MEMSRLDYCVLKILRKNECYNKYNSMTVYEIIEITGTSRCTTSRHIKKLVDVGYLEYGCCVGNAMTYYLTEMGKEFLIESEKVA
jgi:DNA-binding transcriptional regulator GbsR (MarR family)